MRLAGCRLIVESSDYRDSGYRLRRSRRIAAQLRGVDVAILAAALARQLGEKVLRRRRRHRGRTRSRKSPAEPRVQLARSRPIRSATSGRRHRSERRSRPARTRSPARSAVKRSVPPSAVMPPTKFAASCLLRSVANAIRRPPPVMSNDCSPRVEEDDVELVHAFERAAGFRSVAAWPRPAAPFHARRAIEHVTNLLPCLGRRTR